METSVSVTPVGNRSLASISASGANTSQGALLLASIFASNETTMTESIGHAVHVVGDTVVTEGTHIAMDVDTGIKNMAAGPKGLKKQQQKQKKQEKQR